MSTLASAVDSIFQDAGKEPGLEIWRIEDFCPVPVPKDSYGKFFTGDSYIVLKTTDGDGGAYEYAIHYWQGQDTTQDESGTVAAKTVELDEALGGAAVQHREVQGQESDLFLSYFPHCLVPQKGGAASGFKHVEINEREHETRLFICKADGVVRVKEVPVEASSLGHGDIFILDTKFKIFQFNGSNSSIQERAKSFEVVQYLKDTYHEGSCDHAVIADDDEEATEGEAAEFWSFFGGFTPIPSDD